MKNPFTDSPLKQFPYNSRVYTNEFNTPFPSKNYVFVAFTPGYNLQASELNEIQETFYKNTTLYNILFKKWLFIGASGFTSGGNGNPITGPSWTGAIPLDPISGVSLSSNIITFEKDWYLVDDPSGMKFWIYNNNTLSIDGITDGYYGVGITTNYVSGTGDLMDNSGGFPGNSNVMGADRYQINITEAQYQGSTISEIDTLSRSVLLKSGITYNYLNNLLKRKTGE